MLGTVPFSDTVPEFFCEYRVQTGAQTSAVPGHKCRAPSLERPLKACYLSTLWLHNLSAFHTYIVQWQSTNTSLPKAALYLAIVTSSIMNKVHSTSTVRMHANLKQDALLS